ncbi:glucosylceramidase [soil metagenome]
MEPLESRRKFLQYLGSGLVLPLMPTSFHLTSKSLIIPTTSSIQAWSSYDDKRFAPQAAAMAWTSSAPSAVNIVINPKSQFQEILGFGAAFTDAACYTMNHMPDHSRASLLNNFFSAQEMNLTMCRTCIGASDYSASAYTYDEGDADPELKRFSIKHDEEYIIPVLQQSLKVNPDLFLFSSPWTPPGWMKSNNSMLGGNMQRRSMTAYANYFAKFLKAYSENGVPIRAVTIQNEVDTDQDGKMPACAWPQEYEADFVQQYLGPTLEKEGLKTKIWIIDHNYNLWGRALSELELPGVRKYVDGIAWHGYLGQPETMTKVHDAYPATNMYWTEGGPEYTAKNYTTDYLEWSKTFIGILRNWSRSITAWNLALDEVGKPNIGPFFCGGLVTVDSKTHAVTRSGQYWAMAHLSKCIKRGAKRIDSKSGVPIADLNHVAFQNPDGQLVLVISNAFAERDITIQIGERVAEVLLAKNSVTTVVWS